MYRAPFLRSTTHLAPLRALCSLASAVLVIGWCPHLSAQSTLVDRTVAIVDEDPILRSEVQEAIILGLVEAAPDESPAALERRTLDQLIEQRLRLHEVDRFETREPGALELDEQLAEISDAVGGEAALALRLEEAGLELWELRQIIALQLRVLRFVEERLSPRVFVDLDDIRAYYDTTLVPDLEARAIEVPPLERIREEIRALLQEQRLNEEIDRWTEELRAEADVIDLFDRPPGNPLPRVERFDG